MGGCQGLGLVDVAGWASPGLLGTAADLLRLQGASTQDFCSFHAVSWSISLCSHRSGLSLLPYSQDFPIGLCFRVKTCGLIFQSSKKSSFLLPPEVLPGAQHFAQSVSDFQQHCKDRSVAVTRRTALLQFQPGNALA